MTLGLESWADEDLKILLEHRRDLVAPPPPNFVALTNRASGYASIRRAESRLDRFHVAVLHGCCLGTSRPDDPVKLDDLLAVLGLPPVEAPAVAEALDGLRARGLLAVGPSGVGVPATVRVAVPRPAHLGPSARAHFTKQPQPFVERVALLLGLDAEKSEKNGSRGTKASAVERALAALRDTAKVRQALGSAPDHTTSVFDQMVRDGAVLHASQVSWAMRQPSQPIGWLYERGLLVPSGQNLDLPREVGIAFRGGTAFPGLSSSPPALVVEAGDVASVSAAGVAAGNDAVAVIERFVAEWAARPAKLLKTGGVGVRELKRPAKAAGIDEADAGFVAEVAHAAGLVDLDGDEVRATTAFDEWRMAAPGERWLAVARGWLEIDRWPSLSGRPQVDADGRSKVLPALDRAYTSTLAALQRRVVLEVVAGAPAGGAPTAPSVVEAARWRAPGVLAEGPASADESVALVLREAAFLGFMANGALPPVAGALVTGGEAAARLGLDDAFGRPSTEVTLQADLTAVVVGVPDPALRAVLDDAADVESRGAATVWRFCDASVRRALDRGRTAGELSAFLAAHATRPLPQPLAYLIADVGRRHGEVRVARMTSYVRSDDEGLLARVVGTQRAIPLGLRLLAPTVAVSTAEPAVLLTFLRNEGLAPVEEAADGSVVVAVENGPRALAHASWARPAEPDAADVVARLREQQRAMPAPLPRFGLPLRPPATLPELRAAETPRSIRALLEEVAATGEEVELEWETREGRRPSFHEATVRVVSVTGGLVVAVGSDRRRFGYRIALGDITWASLAETEFHDGYRELHQ